MLCLLELISIVKPQGLHVLLSEIWQCIYILCDSLLTNQMALSFNITTLSGYIFCKAKLRLRVSDWQGKQSFAQDCFYFLGRLYAGI